MPATRQQLLGGITDAQGNLLFPEPEETEEEEKLRLDREAAEQRKADEERRAAAKEEAEKNFFARNISSGLKTAKHSAKSAILNMGAVAAKNSGVLKLMIPNDDERDAFVESMVGESRDEFDKVNAISQLSLDADELTGSSILGGTAIRGAVSSLAQLGATAVTGPIGVIGGFAAVAANDGYHSAIDSGLSEEDAVSHGIRSGVIEGGITMLFSGMGKVLGKSALGGFENMKIAKKIAGDTFAKSMKNAGVRLASEMTEESIIGIMGAANDIMAKVDLEHANIGEMIEDGSFQKMMIDTWATTALTMGLAEGGSRGLGKGFNKLADLGEEAVHGKRVKLTPEQEKQERIDFTVDRFSELDPETASRQDVADALGIDRDSLPDEFKSKDDRREAILQAKQMKADREVQQREDTTEAVGPDTQAAGVIESEGVQAVEGGETGPEGAETAQESVEAVVTSEEFAASEKELAVARESLSKAEDRVNHGDTSNEAIEAEDAAREQVEASEKKSREAQGIVDVKENLVEPEDSPTVQKEVSVRAEGRSGKIDEFKSTEDVLLDPERFQFKTQNERHRGRRGKKDVDTGSLAEITEASQFDVDPGGKFGLIQVWLDPKDGKTYVVNGHNRLSKAKELGFKNVPVVYITAANAKAAKLQGAINNLAEGKGTPIDAANFFRSNPEFDEKALRAEGIQMGKSQMKTGMAMSKLSDSAFDAVMDGDITEGEATAIGENLPDHDLQNQLVADIIEAKDAKNELTIGVIRQMAQEDAAGGKLKQDDIFSLPGMTEEESGKTLRKERASVKEMIEEDLRSDSIFDKVAKKKGKLAKGGTVVDEKKAIKIANEAKQLLERFRKIKHHVGPLGDVINNYSRRLASGESKAAVREGLINDAKQALRGESTTDQGRSEADTTQREGDSDTDSTRGEDPVVKPEVEQEVKELSDAELQKIGFDDAAKDRSGRFDLNAPGATQSGKARVELKRREQVKKRAEPKPPEPVKDKEGIDTPLFKRSIATHAKASGMTEEDARELEATLNKSGKRTARQNDIRKALVEGQEVDEDILREALSINPNLLDNLPKVPPRKVRKKDGTNVQLKQGGLLSTTKTQPNGDIAIKTSQEISSADDVMAPRYVIEGRNTGERLKNGKKPLQSDSVWMVVKKAITKGNNRGAEVIRNNITYQQAKNLAQNELASRDPEIAESGSRGESNIARAYEILSEVSGQVVAPKPVKSKGEPLQSPQEFTAKQDESIRADKDKRVAANDVKELKKQKKKLVAQRKQDRDERDNRPGGNTPQAQTDRIESATRDIDSINAQIRALTTRKNPGEYDIGEKITSAGIEVTITTKPYKEFGGFFQDAVTESGKTVSVVPPFQKDADVKKLQDEFKDQQESSSRLKELSKGKKETPEAAQNEKPGDEIIIHKDGTIIDLDDGGQQRLMRSTESNGVRSEWWLNVNGTNILRTVDVDAKKVISIERSHTQKAMFALEKRYNDQVALDERENAAEAPKSKGKKETPEAAALRKINEAETKVEGSDSFLAIRKKFGEAAKKYTEDSKKFRQGDITEAEYTKRQEVFTKAQIEFSKAEAAETARVAEREGELFTESESAADRNEDDQQGLFGSESGMALIFISKKTDKPVKNRDPDDPDVAKAINEAAVAPNEKDIAENDALHIQAMNMITRASQELPNSKKFAVAREIMRLHKDNSERAARETNKALNHILETLRGNPDAYDLFNRIVLMRDLVESNELNEPLRYRFKSDEAVKQELQKLERELAKAEYHGPVEKALKRRDEMMIKVQNELVKRNLIPENNRGEYFRHQIRHYMLAKAVGKASTDGGLNKETPDFARARSRAEDVGASLPGKYDPNSNYLGPEREFLMRTNQAIQAHDALEQLNKSYNILNPIREMTEKHNTIYDKLKRAREKFDQAEREDDEKAMIKSESKIESLQEELLDSRDAIEAEWQVNVGTGPADAKAIALAQEGVVEWQPKPGSAWYPTMTITDGQIKEINKQMELMEMEDLNPEDFKVVMALGSKLETWVIPEQLGKQLDSMKETEDHAIQRFFAITQSSWKKWILHNPLTVFTYNIRNVAGDLDVMLAGNPGALKKVPKALKMIWNWKIHGIESPELLRALHGSVIDAGEVHADIMKAMKTEKFQEFLPPEKTNKEQIATLEKEIRRLTRKKGTQDQVKDLKKRIRFAKMRQVRDPFQRLFWDPPSRQFQKWLVNPTRARESIFRLAAFMDYESRLAAKNKDGTQKQFHYGASRKDDVDIIRKEMGDSAAAAKMARDLTGDYGNVTAMGDVLRKYFIPFWAFSELNIRRYRQININHAKFKPKDSAAINNAIMLYGYSRNLGVIGLMAMWNHILHPEEEELLSEFDRNTPHIIWGGNGDDIYIMRNMSAFGEMGEWFGASDAYAQLKNNVMGPENMHTDADDIVLGMMANFANKAISSSTPLGKGVAEVATGSSAFPSVFTPRDVPRGELATSQVGLSEPYKFIQGMFGDEGMSVRSGFKWRPVTGVVNANKNNLHDAYAKIKKFEKSKGVDSPDRGSGGISVHRNMKNALHNDNRDAFNETFKKFTEARDFLTFTTIMDRMNPLKGSLNKAERIEFIDEFLTPDQRIRTNEAIRYADNMKARGIAWFKDEMRNAPAAVQEQFKKDEAKYKMRVFSKLTGVVRGKSTEKRKEILDDAEVAMREMELLGITPKDVHDAYLFHNSVSLKEDDRSLKTFDRGFELFKHLKNK